jgi:ribose transport system substrate-binding protein
MLFLFLILNPIHKEEHVKKSLVVLLALLMVAAFAFGGATAEKKAPAIKVTPFLGLDTKTVTNAWEDYFQQSFIWWCQDKGYKYLAEEAEGDPATQITQCRQMINTGVNGLIVAAQDKDAAIPIVTFADQAKVPVFTADADINSPNVKMYVGFSGERAGSELTAKLVDYLKQKYNGEVKGTVLEMLGPLGGASAQDRSKGFHDVIDQYKSVKVIQAVGNFQEAPAKTAALNMLRANPNIDAMYSANGPMATGAVDAMKALGIDPHNVFSVSIDATPGVLVNIKNGEVTMALDQAPGFYTAIAAYYLAKYLQEGDSALPKVGETITADQLKVSTGVNHAGIDIWGYQAAWAPAKILTEYGHLWFQTGAILVTKENADAPYLWANIKLPGATH